MEMVSGKETSLVSNLFCGTWTRSWPIGEHKSSTRQIRTKVVLQKRSERPNRKHATCVWTTAITLPAHVRSDDALIAANATTSFSTMKGRKTAKGLARPSPNPSDPYFYSSSPNKTRARTESTPQNRHVPFNGHKCGRG
jgi:hypothetical protein